LRRQAWDKHKNKLKQKFLQGDALDFIKEQTKKDKKKKKKTACAAVEDKLCGGEAATTRSAATCLACMRDSAHRAELAAVGCTNNSTLDFCSNVGTPCQVRAEALCGSARNVSQFDCIMCCGAHQTALEAAACTDPDLEAFCNASQAAASDSS
jgi:ribosomal protein S14